MKGHVVIAGSGIAGLACASRLARQFARVTLLERGPRQPAPGERNGIPQSAHVHLMVARGQQALDELFPGIYEEVERQGARLLELSKDFLILGASGPELRYATGEFIRSCSRNLLQSAIRARVEDLKNVEIRYNSPFRGLRGTSGEVSGVVCASGELDADLVVLATGAHAQVAQWLGDFGCGKLPHVLAPANIVYASRTIRLPQPPADWKFHAVAPVPGVRTRGGILCPIEGEGRYICALFGIGGDFPPADPDQWLKFGKSIAVGDFAKVLETAAFETGVNTYRVAENRVSFPHLAEAWPRRLVMMGDSVAQMNPRFAHGMSMALLSARLLEDFIAEGRTGEGWEREFHRHQAEIHKTPWFFATMTELPAQPAVKRVSYIRTVREKFLRAAFRGTVRDQTLSEAVVRAQHFITPINSLFNPRIFFRVMRAALK
jgi:2-polyprenyl-6-methoxyphenol hydroxylase-like FAD-dependent oxidoreductase